MADKNQGRDDNREIRNPNRDEDIDQIGAAGRQAGDAELEANDEEFEDDDEETDDDQEREDVE